MIWVVGFGGILGAISRYSLSVWLFNLSYKFPLATWIANLTGSFFLGCIFAFHMSNSISDILWLFWGVGFMGSYTTMSTFGFEVVQLLESRKKKLAGFYIVSSAAFGISFAWLGWQLITYIQNLILV